MRFLHWLSGLAVLVGMGILGYVNLPLGAIFLFGGTAIWLATQRGAPAVIRRYVTAKRSSGENKTRRQEAKEQFSRLNKAEQEALRLILLHGSILPHKIRDHLAKQGYAEPERVLDDIRAKTSFVSATFSGDFSVNPSMKDLLEEFIEEPFLAHPIVGYVGVSLLALAVLAVGYVIYKKVLVPKPSSQFLAVESKPSVPSSSTPAITNGNNETSTTPATNKPHKRITHDKPPTPNISTSGDRSPSIGSVTQGSGSIVQNGGTGNSATTVIQSNCADRAGDEPYPYKDMCRDILAGLTISIAQNAISKSQQLEADLDELQKRNEFDQRSAHFKWVFSDDIRLCCLRQMANLRIELINHRIPDAIEDTGESECKSLERPENWRGDTYISWSRVRDCAQYLKKLGLRLKQNVTPRPLPKEMQFSEEQFPVHDSTLSTFGLVATITPESTVSHGYIVVEFSSHPTQVSCDCADCEMLFTNMQTVANQDLIRYLEAHVMDTYGLIIGKTPLTRDRPLHVRAANTVEFHVSKVTLFDE
jgi:hypothetical protein